MQLLKLHEIARRNSFSRRTAPFMFHNVLGAAFILNYDSSVHVLEFESSLIFSDLFFATKVRLGREI